MEKTFMAESGSETDIKVVKEALQAQQQLLQKLYVELDKEREASAIAANETLSMIVRLQGEKAAMKMEANQYQRMAEEKICHAEESLSNFEDIIYQKEMEIASLEFQVQAYRYKLLSLDCSDLGPFEFRFADKLLLQKNEFSPNGEIGVDGKVRRIKSLPPIELDESHYKKDTAERERFEILKPDCCLKLEHPSHHSYWEQIKMLDEQVKEISVSKGCGEERSESKSMYCDQTKWKTCTDFDSSEFEPCVNLKCSSSSSIQDIFEIPEANQNLQKKLIFEDESRLGKPDSIPPEPSELHYKDEKAEAKKASYNKSHKNKSSKSRKGKAVDSSTAYVHQNIDEIVVESQPFQQLFRRIDRLEQERIGTRQEISDAGVEELRLLKEIQNQLNSIQSEMRSLKTKLPSQPDNSAVDILREAMLYFWF